MGASQGMMQMGQAYSQSQSIRAQGEYQRQMFSTNARLADMQADDAIKRGDKAAQAKDNEVKQVIGQQRAEYGAQGVDVNSGSAADVQADTAAIGELDKLTIHNNAWREAWGYKQQALNSSYQGEFAYLSSKNEARNTLVTGGMKAAASFQQAGRDAAMAGA